MPFRILRFLAGFCAGLTLVAVSYLLLKDRYDTDHAGAVSIQASGADMSAQGVARLLVRRRSGVISQVCNGPCDDIRVESHGLSDSVSSIRAVNARGECVACAEGHDGLLTGRLDDWSIAGASRLRATNVRRRVGAAGG